MLLLLLVLTLTNAQPGGAPCRECYRRERGECRRIPGCTALQRGKDDCVKKGVPSKFGTVNGDYCALTGGQYRCGSGGVLCCNTGFKPKSNGNSFYCPGGPKKLSTDAPSVSCDLQPKKVCTGRREEYLDDTAGESGHMNPGRCQEICEKHEAEGCCMYEVDHLRCFIVKSGGALKTDNSVKREYTSLGYHGVNYNEVPQRHAGFCKKKAENSVAVVTQPASATSYAVHGLALLGLGALLYGAGAHYFKKEGAHVEF